MGRDYEVSDLLKLMGDELVKAEHPHLKRAKIAYVMKKCGEEEQLPKLRIGKHPKFAKARKVTPVFKALSGYDFVIEVDELWWNTLSPDQQTALIDHELTHCVEDENGWYLKDHDVEEFTSLVRRRGLWNSALESFVAAVPEQKELFEEPRQRREYKQAAGSKPH